MMTSHFDDIFRHGGKASGQGGVWTFPPGAAKLKVSLTVGDGQLQIVQHVSLFQSHPTGVSYISLPDITWMDFNISTNKNLLDWF